MNKPNEGIPDYGMFSIDGNEAVNRLITHLQEQFWDGIKTIKAQHPEVMHAGAIEKIWTSLKNFYHTNPHTLTTLKKESKIGDYVRHEQEIVGLLLDVTEDKTKATIKLRDGSVKEVNI